MAFVLLAALVAGSLWWFAQMRAKEQAVEEARRACRRHEMLLLDETVVLDQLRLRRDRYGTLRPYREYRFEFTTDGGDRRGGRISLFFGRVVALSLELEEGTLHDLH